jgi:hypothetical protein
MAGDINPVALDQKLEFDNSSASLNFKSFHKKTSYNIQYAFFSGLNL